MEVVGYKVGSSSQLIEIASVMKELFGHRGRQGRAPER